MIVLIVMALLACALASEIAVAMGDPTDEPDDWREYL